MRYGFFFFGIILFGLGYELMHPYDDQLGRINIFFLSSREIYPSSYFYYSGGHLIDICFGLLAIKLFSKIPSINEFKHYVILYIVLEAIDLADFWFTNNEKWFEYHECPVTFNIIKVLVYTLVLAYDFIWDFLTGPPAGINHP